MIHSSSGVRITPRLRHDFTVTGVEKHLATARRATSELDPDTGEERAAQMVTCAPDAIYTLLERNGVVGDLALPGTPDGKAG